MWTFRAMSTDVAITAPMLAEPDQQALARDIARMFAETERRFSRFREDSELSVLNRATGPVVVSPELLELLLVAREHAAETAGLFDASVGSALLAAGYDRSFWPGTLDREQRGPARPDSRDALAIDERTRRVTRPAGVQLDFGGFLKGRTVDRAAARMPGLGAVDAGGDAMLRGAGLDGDGWLVDVEDPFDERATLVTLRVRDRAVATSAANRRSWRIGGELAHHLIDPRTHAPSRSDLAQVTVLAPTAERADVMAKVVFLLGAAKGEEFVARHEELGAVLVTRTGDVRLVGNVVVARA